VYRCNPQDADNFTSKTLPRTKTLKRDNKCLKVFQWYSRVFSFSIESRRAIGALLLCVTHISLLVRYSVAFPEIQYRFISSLMNSRFCYGRYIPLDVKVYTFSSPQSPFSNFFSFFPWIRFRTFREHAKIDIRDVELCK